MKKKHHQSNTSFTFFLRLDDNSSAVSSAASRAGVDDADDAGKAVKDIDEYADGGWPRAPTSGAAPGVARDRSPRSARVRDGCGGVGGSLCAAAGLFRWGLLLRAGGTVDTSGVASKTF